jgi:hypothetical protein
MQQIAKLKYLDDPVVSNFVKFVKRLLEGASFHHEYTVRDPKRPNGYDPNFRISTIEEAFDRYFWNRGDFVLNKQKLDDAKAAVDAAILQEGSEGALLATREALKRVLHWGSGGRTRSSLYTQNVAWAKQCGPKLIAHLKSGRAQMTSDQPDFSVFRSGPRMNAGFTKYYALACDNVIIYDGRVGAAMGLLARQFCIEEKLKLVPPAIAFQWGAARSKRNRDPTIGCLEFKRLDSVTRADQWASSNVAANWILTEALKRSTASWCGRDDGLRRVEGALFMIGYDIPRT